MAGWLGPFPPIAKGVGGASVEDFESVQASR